MELKDIAAVAGKSGLYKVVKPTRTGVILETLDASKKKLIANANARVSILKEISIYTTTEEGSVLLEEVLEVIFEKYGKELPVTGKSTSAEMESFISEIVPDFDSERVYTSDIKKLISWYNLLVNFAPELFEKPAEQEPKTEDSNAEPVEAATEKEKSPEE